MYRQKNEGGIRRGKGSPHLGSGRRGPARVAAFAGEGAGGEKALVVAPLGRRK